MDLYLIHFPISLKVCMHVFVGYLLLRNIICKVAVDIEKDGITEIGFDGGVRLARFSSCILVVSTLEPTPHPPTPSPQFVPFETRYPPEWVHDPDALEPRMEFAQVCPPPLVHRCFGSWLI